MTQNEFDQFVNMMLQAKKVQDSVYKDFRGLGTSVLSCDYMKHECLCVNRYMTTKIYISRWMHEYVFEVKVAIRREGEKRKGVVPLEQNTLECHRISAKVIDFKEVEQEAIAMAQKLGWL